MYETNSSSGGDSKPLGALTREEWPGWALMASLGILTPPADTEWVPYSEPGSEQRKESLL